MSDILISKLRPRTLDEVVGQPSIVRRLKRQAKAKHMNHALFEGDHGIGKTTCALALCYELYGDSMRNNVLQLNASDKRGIDVVRDDIQDFAKVVSTHPDVPFKVIYLDEADALTKDAQQTLRWVTEHFSENNRFIFTCNYKHKIIAPIQDRCSLYSFKPIDKGLIFSTLKNIANEMNITISDESLQMISKDSRGSMRKALNVLGELSIGQTEINEEDVRDVVNTLLTRKEIGEFIKHCKEQNWQEANRYYYTLRFTNVDVLTLIHEMIRYIEESQNIPNDIKCRLYYLLGELEWRCTQGADPWVQLRWFISQIKYLKGTTLTDFS